jgi:shikimate kinase
MLTEFKDKEVIIFEGQVNLEFVKSGFLENNFSNYEIILIDCNEEVMAKRLSEDRKQPELVNENMKNWLRFLRKQAKEVNAQIIDTSNKTKSKVLSSFESILKKHQVI